MADMVNSTVHTLSVLFAIVSGTGAGLFALLFWQVLRESPFGTVIMLLTVTMSTIIVYHVVLFIFEPDTLLLATAQSALYSIVAIFIWLVITTHHRVKNSAVKG